ncbi:TPA: hypothetical protein ENS27_06880 [bacterium]|nr:hypothetical protein [bacterium]
MSKPEMQKEKIFEGVYRDGNIIVKDLHDVKNGDKVVVIFNTTKKQIEEIALKLGSQVINESEKIALQISDDEMEKLSDELDITKSIGKKAEPKPFSIKKSKFFSNKPEHLGKTSAKDLDKILADEAMGIRKWKKSS